MSRKTSRILDVIVSQGLMNENEAISMIRQGRIKINNRNYFDPKHGISLKYLKHGSLIQIDKRNSIIILIYIYYIINPTHCNIVIGIK